MRKKSIWPAFLALALVWGGCKKETGPVPAPTPEPAGKRLVKVQEGTEDFTAFEYYPDGKLKKVTTSYNYGSGPLVSAYNITYDDGGKIEEVHSDEGFTTYYIYDGDKPVLTELWADTGKLVQVNFFVYDGDRLQKHSLFVPEEPGAGTTLRQLQETQFSYYSNGNLRESVLYGRSPATGNLEKFQVHKYDQYDTRINPYRSLGDFGLVCFRYVNTVNSLKELLYDRHDVLQETTENTFTYDDEGYPLSNIQKITPGDSAFPTTINITYTYQ